MLISELMHKLEQIKNKYGDNPVFLCTTDWEGGTSYVEAQGIELVKDEDSIRVELHDGCWDYTEYNKWGDSTWIETNPREECTFIRESSFRSTEKSFDSIYDEVIYILVDCLLISKEHIGSLSPETILIGDNESSLELKEDILELKEEDINVILKYISFHYKTSIPQTYNSSVETIKDLVRLLDKIKSNTTF